MDRIQALAREFFAREAAGEKLTLEEWCRQHPEVSDELRRCVESLRQQGGDDPTLTPGDGAAGTVQPEPTLPPDETFEATFEPRAVPPSKANTPPLDAGDLDQAETLPIERGPLFDNRYRIVRVLGEGGFGKVYLVEDTFHEGEQLALKLVKPEHQDTEQFAKRFRNEIRILRALHHDGIPPIYNDGVTEEGHVYFTMAYVPGTPLEDLVASGAGITPFDLANYVRQIVATLEFAHAQGIVHRDLKPANVIVQNPGTPEARVKILDFGIAKVLKREGSLEGAMTMQTQMPMGTPHYMAPEQIRGQEVDGRTDLYALGIMIYRMVSGSFPFTGKTAMEVLTARLHDPPTPPSAGTEPHWAVALALELLEKDKQKRPTTQRIEEMIEAGLQGKASSRKISPVVWVGLGVLVIAILLIWMTLSREQEARESQLGIAGPIDTPPGGQAASSGDPVAATADPGDFPVAANPDDRNADPTALARAIFTNLTPDAVFSKTPVRVEGWVSAPPEGGLFLNGATLVPDKEGRFSVPLQLDEGSTSLVLLDGNGKELCDPTTIHVDLSDPVLELDVAAGLLLTRDQAVTFTGRASDRGTGKIRTLKCEGDEVALGADGAFAHSLALTSEGTRLVRFVLEDSAGRTAQREISVNVDRTPPTVRVTPEPPAETTLASLQLTGTASDAGPVHLLLNGNTLNLRPDGSFETDVPLAIGVNRVHLLATDQVGEAWEKTWSVLRSDLPPRVPTGCVAVEGATAVEGWARAIRHGATEMELMLIGSEGERAFYVGRTEVTRAQFDRIAQLAPTQSLAEPDHPAVDLTFDEALAWCRRAGLQLPSPEEWMRASQAGGARLYPWGAEWDVERCHTTGRPASLAYAGACPVDAVPGDVTPSGLVGMAGNVSEWCNRAGSAAFLGGSFADSHPADCAIDRLRPQGRLPKSRPTIGFRAALWSD